MRERITIADIQQIKTDGRKFAAVSCYDYTTAQLVTEAGVEMILVGDTAAQMILGHDSTLPATMDFMVTITEAVRRAAPLVCMAADMPFLSYQTGIADAVRNAGRFVQQAGAQIVKIEIKPSQLDIIKAISDADIPVMAHLGIRPQSIAKQVKLKAEGATAQQAYELMILAEDAVKAGASMVLLEGTARETAAMITRQLAVAVLGCGSGPDCDGQILIINDILGLSWQPPKFAKAHAKLRPVILSAVQKYAEQVRGRRFPDDKHCYHIKPGQLELLKKMSGQSRGQ
jgi:3-methyl-2-oxobutanoate hydroxymethyltransferase